MLSYTTYIGIACVCIAILLLHQSREFLEIRISISIYITLISIGIGEIIIRSYEMRMNELQGRIEMMEVKFKDDLKQRQRQRQRDDEVKKIRKKRRMSIITLVDNRQSVDLSNWDRNLVKFGNQQHHLHYRNSNSNVECIDKYENYKKKSSSTRINSWHGYEMMSDYYFNNYRRNEHGIRKRDIRSWISPGSSPSLSEGETFDSSIDPRSSIFSTNSSSDNMDDEFIDMSYDLSEVEEPVDDVATKNVVSNENNEKRNKYVTMYLYDILRKKYGDTDDSVISVDGLRPFKLKKVGSL